MPEFRKILDVYQGYNFKKDKQTAVGFVTKLKFGETELKADQTCKNPTKPEEDLKVVAVLSDILWETGITDAIYFSGQVSVQNKQDIQALIYKTMTDVLCEFQFSVFDYDPAPDKKKYYLCFHSNNKDMKGLIEKKGEDLNLTVADDASTQVQSPLNYAFQTGIKPQPEAQDLQVAVGDSKNFTKAWGLKLG
jgi:hypothetical protein